MAETQTEADNPTRNQEAFQALVGLAVQSRRSAKGLPSQVDTKPHWSGIGFELLGRHFVAPMGEVSEMLEVPYYTRLPGVKPWVKGVANVRGRLLPVCDLAIFLGGRIQAPRKQQRILVLENEDLYTGLLVDRVFGMQHFPVDTYSPAVNRAVVNRAVVNSSVVNSAVIPGNGAEGVTGDESVVPFCHGHFSVDGVEWTVFRPEKLSADPHFLNAAQS